MMTSEPNSEYACFLSIIISVSCEICKIFKKTNFEEDLRTTAFMKSRKHCKKYILLSLSLLFLLRKGIVFSTVIQE